MLSSAHCTAWRRSRVPRSRCPAGPWRPIGGPATPPPTEDSPLMRNLEAELAEQAGATRKNCERIARIVAALAADSLIADRPQPVPDRRRSRGRWLTGCGASRARKSRLGQKRRDFSTYPRCHAHHWRPPVAAPRALTVWTPARQEPGKTGFSAFAIMEDLESSEPSSS